MHLLLAALIAVASSDGSHVTLLDARTLTAVAKVDVGAKPHEIALSSDHRLAWVANTKDKSVTAIDLQHRRPLRTHALVDCSPHDLRPSRDHQLLWVTCAPERVVLELDAASGTTRKRYELGQDGAWMLAASADETLLVTANLEGGGITFVDRAGATRTTTTARGEIGLDVAPDGTVWTTNLENGTVALFTRGGERLGTVAGAKTPLRVKITPDGRRAVITDRSLQALAIVDVASRTIAKTIPLPQAPKVLALSPDGKQAAVSAPGANELFVVDLERGAVRRVAIGGVPDGVAWAEVPAAPVTSVTATIPERDLVPEGIAYDPVTRRFFVGSTWRRKIVAVDRDGKARDFFAGETWGLVGMRVDAKRRRLWAVTSHAGRGMPMIDMDAADEGRSAVLELDVDSGRLLRRYELPDRGRFLNDLVVTAGGDVFITDTAKHAILTIPRGGELQPFVQLDGFQWPNGIDLTPDGTRLVVAVARNIVTIDLRDKSVRALAFPPHVAFRMADGLYVHGDSVITVQPWMPAHEVERYVVDPAFARVLRAEPLVSAHPLLEQPTTAVIVGDRLHLLANSHLQTFAALFRAGEHDTLERMREVTILSVRLPEAQSAARPPSRRR